MYSSMAELVNYGSMAELVDALDLKSNVHCGRPSSSLGGATTSIFFHFLIKDRNSNTFLNLDLSVKVLTVGNIGVIGKINICPVNLVDFIENPILPTQFCGRVKRICRSFQPHKLRDTRFDSEFRNDDDVVFIIQFIWVPKSWHKQWYSLSEKGRKQGCY